MSLRTGQDENIEHDFVYVRTYLSKNEFRSLEAFERRLLATGIVEAENTLRPGVIDQLDRLEEHDEDAQIGFSYPHAALSLLNIFLFLEARLAIVHSCADAVAIRMAEAMKKVNNTFLKERLNALHSAAYECVVLLRFSQAGFDGVFIPTTHHETPDLLFEGKGLLVECKDGQTERALSGDLEGVANWARTKSRKAFGQLHGYDRAGGLCHVVCLDLPEGTFHKIQSLDAIGREKFFRAVYHDQNSEQEINPKALHILFSSIEFDRHLGIRTVEQSPLQGEAWLYPPMVGPMDMRMANLYNHLFHSLGDVPYPFVGELVNNQSEYSSSEQTGGWQRSRDCSCP